MQPDSDLAPKEMASFLAGKAIAAATSYLDGRTDGAVLARQSKQLCGELLVVFDDPCCTAIVVPTRLLVATMLQGAMASREVDFHWRLIMIALVGLVRHHAHALHETGGAGR